MFPEGPKVPIAKLAAGAGATAEASGVKETRGAAAS